MTSCGSPAPFLSTANAKTMPRAREVPTVNADVQLLVQLGALPPEMPTLNPPSSY